MQPSNNSPRLGRELAIPSTFPKEVRLRKRTDFTRLSCVQQKKSVRGFLVIWLKNDCGTARLGVTASRKVGCAVVRNRVRRCLREIFRRVRFELNAVDVSIIVRRESSLMTYAEMAQELNKAFQFIGAAPCSNTACSL